MKELNVKTFSEVLRNSRLLRKYGIDVTAGDYLTQV
jgi:hypothetical protein